MDLKNKILANLKTRMPSIYSTKLIKCEQDTTLLKAAKHFTLTCFRNVEENEVILYFSNEIEKICSEILFIEAVRLIDDSNDNIFPLYYFCKQKIASILSK